MAGNKKRKKKFFIIIYHQIIKNTTKGCYIICRIWFVIDKHNSTTSTSYNVETNI